MVDSAPRKQHKLSLVVNKGPVKKGPAPASAGSSAADEISRLYQLPLDEFTPARNALAKRLGRTEPPIKDLQKPNVAAWAVNQLYWRDRGTYDRLVQAADRVRAEHRTLLAGGTSNIRDTEKAHRQAVRAATEKTRAIITESGQAASPDTMRAVSETLEALPGAEPPGRLTRPLKPMGFEALTGVSVRPAVRPSPKKDAPEAKRAGAAGRRDAEEARRQAEAAQQQAAAATREAREEKARQRAADAERRRAKAAVQRAEAAFEKADRETKRRAEELDAAREALRRLPRTT